MSFDVELARHIHLAGHLKAGVNEAQVIDLLSDKIKSVFSNLPELENDLTFLILVCRCVGSIVKSKHKLDKKKCVLSVLVALFPAMSEQQIADKSITIDQVIELGLVHGVPRLTKWYYKLFGQKKAA